jgi:membrane-bound lytic murein transglycosylase D
MKKIILLTWLACYTLLIQAQNQNPRYKNTNADNYEKPISNHVPINVTVPEVPKSYTLFGEKIPLEQWDIRERFDRELLVNTYMQGTTCYIIKLMGRYMPMIEERLKANNVPDDFKYLCVAESALQNQISKAGAVGFWQFMKGTAPSFGLHIDDEVDERYNPEKATDAACAYLKQAYNKFGNWTAAAASYNCGMGGYNGAMTAQGENSFYNLLLPEETMRYIFRIAALKYILSNPTRSGFNLDYDDVYHSANVKRVTITYGIGDLIQYAKNKGTNYKMLKLLNPWMREKYLNNTKGRTYTVILPQ